MPVAGSTAGGPNAKRLYAVGGRQAVRVPQSAPTEGREARYDLAVILEIDVSRRSIKTVFEYETPTGRRPDEDPSILFKSATLADGLLYVPTQTEVAVYRVPDFHQVGYVSIPMFNDVHHVRPSPEGGIVIANTGLDMVVDLSLDGSVRQEWSAIGEDPWLRFSRAIDHRMVRSTKPHLAHPNHVFYVDDELWVTRFEQRDAISLVHPGRRIDVGLARVHDGLVYGDRIYFTTVDGKVAIAGKTSLAIETVIDLSRFYPPDTLLGWTRGIAVDEHGFWVGFSRLRYTRFRENLGWAMRGFRHEPRTRVAYFDVSKGTVGPTFELESRGMNAVFSVLEVD